MHGLTGGSWKRNRDWARTTELLKGWLPPGGVDNGVWASARAELADLDAADVTPVLQLLADADVGGYVGSPGGGIKRPGRRVIHRLWVDSMQYHRAEDVLMGFLHNRSGGQSQPESPGFSS